MDDQRTNRASGGMSELHKRRPWSQFSVRTLLVVMLLVAVYFVGRRNGYQKSLADAPKAPANFSTSAYDEMVSLLIKNPGE